MASKNTKNKKMVETIIEEVKKEEKWEALRLNHILGSVVIRQEHLSFKDGFIIKEVDTMKSYYPVGQIINYQLLTKKML